MKHRIFDVFAGERNSFLPLVNVFRYWTVPRGWQPEAEKDVEIIAWLRNKSPLAAERRFGRGRVVAFLTTAAPVWNNWARENPSYIVAMLELQAYLGGGRRPRESCLVGEPLRFPLDAGQYAAQVRFTKPPGRVESGEARAESGESTVNSETLNSQLSTLNSRVPGDAHRTVVVDAPYAPDGKLAVVLDDTDASGMYEAALKLNKGGKEEVRHYAVNVDPAEGNLKTLWGPELAARLKDAECEFHQAATFRYASEERAGSNLSLALLFVLVGLLVGEQLLAYSASYHLPKTKGLGAGDWGLGTRGRRLGARNGREELETPGTIPEPPIPSPRSPAPSPQPLAPNPQSPGGAA